VPEPQPTRPLRQHNLPRKGIPRAVVVAALVGLAVLAAEEADEEAVVAQVVLGDEVDGAVDGLP
jgi:hypothetical protein